MSFKVSGNLIGIPVESWFFDDKSLEGRVFLNLGELQAAHTLTEPRFCVSFERIVDAVHTIVPHFVGDGVGTPTENIGNTPQRVALSE